MNKEELYTFYRLGREAKTNIPHLVTHHGAGFEWGYSGSGPAELALNILEDVLQRAEFRGPRCECFKGFCFQLAWDLHQDLKRDLIARMPPEGSSIAPVDLINWIKDQRPEVVLEWA